MLVQGCSLSNIQDQFLGMRHQGGEFGETPHHDPILGHILVNPGLWFCLGHISVEGSHQILPGSLNCCPLPRIDFGPKLPKMRGLHLRKDSRGALNRPLHFGGRLVDSSLGLLVQQGPMEHHKTRGKFLEFLAELPDLGQEHYFRDHG